MSELIRFEKVSKAYTSTDIRTHALRDVDFSISAGEFVSVSGPSGCGKSTLMNLLGLLDFPDSGTVTAFGSTFTHHDEAQLTRLRRGNIGFIFQAFNLIEDLTILQNVEMPLHYVDRSAGDRRSRATDLLEQVGLGGRLSHHPSQLSGGQQQRVAIARALAPKPKLIVADEPTGNLDSQNSLAIMELLEQLTDTGAGVVIVTHAPELAERAQRRISMKDGQVIGLDRRP
ncbi:ABC transporter ATP-binding protein [Brevundimonas diminuta]|jgi:putative ABC transport system ATP-binding protein|uniref:ABC transporter ATP-binding protein n=1 Tax=Brevundimonas TaxID=41275 RepID=UPI0019071491|nr:MULTISPECIES: ABC transporter ATP-binding protein [Brevundimonas]MBK1970287.1 ABC transporter ATP-binding protein [Brevundimonas diminuta]MBK1975870.1 ABC transporter ATP-binding protein [Brevundimonas diminuta]